MKTIKIIIVEDHQSMIDGINLLLKYEKHIDALGYFKNGKEVIHFLSKLPEENYPDVILTDVKMPEMNGVDFSLAIKEQFPSIEIIAFSMLAKESVVTQMLQAGISGYLLKNSSLELILDAINEVSRGNTFFDRNLREIVEKYEKNPRKNRLNKPVKLTKSEREILVLIAEGKISSEIAEIRFTAVSTVEKHRKNMIRKLGLTGKNDLLRYAVEKKFDDLN
ncbi:MAG: response regulator transcription factor [Flavobacteriaceae bacterium]